MTNLDINLQNKKNIGY